MSDVFDNSLEAEALFKEQAAEERDALIGLANSFGWQVVCRRIDEQIMRLQARLESVELDLDRHRAYAGQLLALRRVKRIVEDGVLLLDDEEDALPDA